MVDRPQGASHRHGEFAGPTVFDFTTARHKQGKVLSTRYRVVCKHCNETWMSRAEAEAKSILLELMQGFRTELTLLHKQTLARWLVLKAMVIDKGQKQGGVLGARSLDCLRDGQIAIGSGWHAWIGASEMEFGQCGFIRTAGPSFLYRTATGERISPAASDLANSFVLSIYSGRFLAVVAWWPFPRGQVEYWDNAGSSILARIWPSVVVDTNPLVWPPALTVTLGGMVHLSDAVWAGEPLPEHPRVRI
jgi:hypothetical protein